MNADACHHCGAADPEWIGFTRRALKRLRSSRDVQGCSNCGAAWYFARTGRRMRIDRHEVQQ